MTSCSSGGWRILKGDDGGLHLPFTWRAASWGLPCWRRRAGCCEGEIAAPLHSVPEGVIEVGKDGAMR